MRELTGRFAPTPSGRLHLGNLYCALLAWLSVRSRGGRLLLRVEDLDRARLPDMEEATGVMLADLAWLGLDFDGGASPADWQSARSEVYAAALERLRAAGLVYPCYCSRAELHAAAAPHLGDGRVRYDGRCYRLLQSGGKAPDRRAALRVHLPEETVVFTDLLRGVCRESLTEGGDPIVRRSDGVFAYQLAAAVDDGSCGVTEVVRGQDLYGSTAVQVWLCRTLGYEAPDYLHIPLLLAPDGRRLSKRDGDDDLSRFRAGGWRPEAVLGLLGYCAGQLPRPEALTLRELLSVFAREKIPREDVCLPASLLRR